MHSSRIWDQVEWTKPRHLATNKGLTNHTGQTVTDPLSLAQMFNNQFTPPNPRAVDETIVEEMDHQDEQFFPPFGPQECRDALSKVSNFSAPGLDHISWFWLKRIVVNGISKDNQCEDAFSRNTETLMLKFFNTCIFSGI